MHRPLRHRRLTFSALQLFSLSAFLCLAPSLSAQTVVAVTPTSTTLDSLSENSPASQLTDQSGLSTGYTSGTTTFATATTATHNNTSSSRWLSNGDTTGSMVFDLGDTFTLTSFALWNMASSSSQAVNWFTIETSATSDFTSATTVLSSSAGNSGVNSAAPSQNFSLTETDARYVRWNITSNKGNSTITAAGEVLFGGYLAAISIFDAEVLSLMDRGGYSGDPTIYVLGENAAYDKTFSSAATLGSTKDYNQLLIQNGSVVDFASGQDQLTLDSDHNTVTVDDPGSSLTVATLTNNGTDNVVQVTDGGFIDVDSLVLGDNASLALEIDGTDAILQRDSATLGTGATLSSTVGNGGTYQVHDAVAEAITLNDGGTLHVTGLDSASSFELDTLASLTFESGATIKSDVALSDDATFTVSSGRTVDISGGGSFDSAFTLDGGTVEVNDFNLATDNLTFTSGTLDTSGTLTVGSDNSTQTISGVISGSGSLTKTGSGDLTLSGTNSYSGGTTVSSGTLTGTSSSLQGDIVNNAALTFDQDSDGTFSDEITGSGSLTKTGTGSLTLSGSNDYSGDTTLSAGTLVGTNANLGSGTLNLDGGTLVTTTYDATNLSVSSGTVVASGTLTNLPTIDSNLTVDLASGGVFGDATTLNGGTVATDDFDYASGNLFFISGTHEATGTVSGLPALAPGTTLVLDGGTWSDSLDNGSGGSLTLLNGASHTNNAGIFNAANLTFTSGTLTVKGELRGLDSLASTDQTVVIDGASANWTPTGSIEPGIVRLADGGTLNVDDYDATNFDLSSDGTLAITGMLSNLATIDDDLTVALAPIGNLATATTLNGGTLTVTDDVFDLSNLVFDHGTVEMDAAVVAPGSLAPLVSPLGPQTVSLANASIWDVGPADINNVNLSIDGGSVLVLLGTSYDASLLTFTSGRIDLIESQLTNLNTLGTDQTVAMLGQSSTWSPAGNIDDGAITLTGGTLSVTNYDAANLTFGSGTLAASGTLTNLPSIASNDIVDLTPGGSFGDTTTLAGGTVKVSNFDYTNGNLNFEDGTLDVAGTLTAGTGDTSDAISGYITGTGDLIKTGSGTLTLSSINTYSGGTSITAGTLSGTNVNFGSGSLTIDGGTLETTSFDGTNLTFINGSLAASGSLTNLPTIATNNTVDITPGGSFGSATILAGGTAKVDDFNLATDNLTFISGTLDTSGTLTVGSDDSSPSIFGVITGTGDLTKTGSGTLTLYGANTYSGGTTVAAGTLSLVSNSAAGTGAITTTGSVIDYADGVTIANVIDLQSDSTQLQVTTGTATQSGAISETGGSRPLEKIGDGTLVLTGTNTYSGGTTISAGTLSAAPTNLGSGAITINGGTLSTTTFDGSGNTFTSGGLTASSTVSNLPTIASGMSVDISSGGSFGDTTTLDGGTVSTAAFDYSSGNLTFTSGTHEASGSLSNVPDIQSGMTVDLSSGGSFATATTLDGGNLNTAAFDGTNLTTNSGTLSASGSLTNLPSITTGVTVDVSNGGSFGDTTTLDGGTVQSGAFDYSTGNLTFTSGTHELSGALTNLNTLGANQSVVLTGSSATWSPTGDIDAGNVTLDSNARLKVADYDASNLTFTSGTITTTGDLTNFTRSSTGQKVILNSGAEWQAGDVANLSGITISGGTLETEDLLSGQMALGTASSGSYLFTSGTIKVTGDFVFDAASVFDLPVIETGRTLDLTEADSITFQNNDFTFFFLEGGTLRLGTIDSPHDLVEEYLTRDGRVEFTGTVTNLNLTEWSARHEIVLDGGTLSETENLQAIDITLQNGGHLTVDRASFNAANLTFTDGTLTATGSLTNLPTLAANNTVDISDGGSLGDATTLNGGTLQTAAADLANLTFTSGLIEATGALTNVPTIAANRTIDISGGGSFGDASTLNGGTLQTADFDMANLTFTSGTIESAGALTNLNTLGSGQAVDLNGASATWSPSGDIDDGDVTLQNAAALTIGDYDATNLTFTDGTLETTGILTNLNTLTADQTVNINGGSWSPSGDIDAGNVILHNTGQLTVGDFDASNLVGVSGDDANPASTLTTTGTLTNLNPAANLNMAVVLDGGTWADSSVNADFTTTLQNGGTLSTTSYDASNLIFTNGTLTTTGALTNLNTLSSGNTVVLDGATWSPSGDIDDGSLTLQNAAAFTIGDYDATNLTFTNGSIETDGALTNLNTLTSSDQVVTLNGASATWSPTGNIDAGTVTLTEGSLTLNTSFDASNFTFDTAHGGGPLTGTLTMTTGALTNLNSLGLSAGVVLDGDSSWAPTGDVSAGYVTLNHANAALSINGDFDSRFITFNAGTLTTNGTIGELNSLTATQNVVMDGGSWSPTGNIDSGSLTLQNAAALTISDYDATNLTFTSGSITTDGALTNLNTLNANHTVTIDGSGASWSPTGNIDAGTVTLTEGSLTLNTSFDASNLTFASTFSEPVALLTMNSGTLSNLNTLQVGQRVTLNGSSSWAPTGNIETGETVLNSANATLTTTGDLDTRAVVFNAGTLAGDGVLSELPTIGTNMTVDLSSGGSLGTATTLDGGELYVDDFDATHLSLSSGEIYASGDVSNLPTIGGNVYVNMSSDAAFTTATTLDGGEVGFDSVPGIFDFSTSNLTFTSGSLYFYDEGIANLPDITSGQTVYLADAGFATSTTLNGGDLVLEGTIDYNDLELTFTTGTLTVGFEGELANLPAITANQTVDITEGGFITTTFLAGGTLITEDFDENDEVLFAFGTLQASGAVHDLGSIINGQTVDISNGGSIEDLTTLNGGTLRVDDFDFDEDPVIFTAGTVVALGNVYLEDDLESGMILDITAGGELGGGTNISGGTLKTVDYNADGGPGSPRFYEGTLSVTGELTGLHRLDGPGEGDGQTVILDGGTWSPDRAESNSDYINDGSVTIQNDGLLIVNGNYDATNLTFTNGTLALTNEAELENLNTLGTGQTVVLDDAFWMAAGDINAGNIEITNGGFLVANSGGGASTEFDASNLTFTSGALAVEDQDLVNLNTVGTNQTVYLNNGSWSPTGSIDNADEIGLYNNAALTVGDYNASNLDFDSGTVTTTGELTNLDTLGADNAVVIDGGEWLPSGGDISAGTVTVQNDGLLGVGLDFSTGTYDASNLTLTSGTLATNHDITNLDTIGAGATVELFADADWSPAGNIDAGTVRLNGGTLTVGDYDATNLPLSFDGADAGGTLVTTGTLTNLDGLTATLNVTLDGGTWATTGDIDAGSVTVQNDGNLGVADYDASNLTLTAGTVTATGTLTQLNSLASTDQTIVLDGGTWSPTGSVGAGNVTLQNDGTLNVGDYDATRLTLTAGTVTSDGSLTNLPTITTGNTIDVTLGGTIDSATTLAGGTIDATKLDATQVTFTSGTLNVAGGPLTNLDTLGANQTVTLDNASWSTTGDIDGGNVTLSNNANLTVADYDTANLTFTSGTLEATGTLTHDQQLAANQTVRLNGNSATYDVGSDLQLSAGTIELANGGTLNVGSHTATVLDADTVSFDPTGGTIALDGGTLNLASLDGPFGLDANASITGNGSIFGDVGLGVGGTIDGDATGLEVFGHISGTGTLADVTLFGNLTIGNSPGDITLENTTLSASTVIALAIEGPDVGQFDRLFIDADSDVSLATLNITFDGYTPESIGLTFALVSNSSGTLFANVNTPEGWSFSNGMLSASAVPEPSSFALLFGITTLGFTATRRRSRKATSIE